MATRTWSRMALIGIGLAVMLIPVGLRGASAQPADLDAAAAAKAAAGRKALAHPATPGSVGNFISFDAPGAGTGSGQGTYPSSINPAGAITGHYVDANSLSHGFLRASNGIITTFDVPGDVNGTYPSSINPAGAITGTYYDANFVGHGFLRAKNGTFITFDAPGAVATFPYSINPEAAITGFYADVNDASHGFLRAKNGTFITFVSVAPAPRP